MQGEPRETQTTPVPSGKGKGKEREVVIFSDVEELDGPPSPKGSKSSPRWGTNSCGLFVTTKFFPFSNSGVLTPVDPPLKVGSAVIATDQVMEIDKAELIPVKTMAVSVSVCFLSGPLPYTDHPGITATGRRGLTQNNHWLHSGTPGWEWGKSAEWPLTEQRFPLRRVKTFKSPLNHNHTEMVEGRIFWENKTKEYMRGELGIYMSGCSFYGCKIRSFSDFVFENIHSFYFSP